MQQIHPETNEENNKLGYKQLLDQEISKTINSREKLKRKYFKLKLYRG